MTDSTVPPGRRLGPVAIASLVAILALGALTWWLATRRSPVGDGAAPTPASPAASGESPAMPDLPFTDVTAAAGIDWVHANGATGEKLLPETMGGGGGFFDFDRDGDQDLALVNSSAWPHDPPVPHEPGLVVYRNEGGFAFRRVPGPTERFYGMGLAFGDADGDGWTDVYVTALGENRLYRNVEGRGLEDVTARAGVAGPDDAWSTCAAFLDYDRDGDLDLFVGDYVVWSRQIDLDLDYRLAGIGRAYGPPLNYAGTQPRLYRNDGDGIFTEVGEAAGLHVLDAATGAPIAKSLAVLPIDLDRDGWLDLFVANDTTANFLFHNRGDGTFEEVAEPWGLAYDRDGHTTGAMGADAGHHRNDGELALVVGNFANETTSVYVSQGDPTLFVDEAMAEGLGGLTRTALTFGLFLFDADLDGRLDLLQNNGHLEQEIARVDPSQSYRQAPQVFWNAGPGAQPTFVPVPAERTGDLPKPIVGRGAAYADVDSDGDLDLLLLQTGGPPRLLRNDQATGHHWLRLRLEGGPAVGREALAAIVEVRTPGQTQRRQVMPSRSYLSHVELPLTFGLGSAETAEATVLWPDGSREEIGPLAVDREHLVRQGQGSAVAAP